MIVVCGVVRKFPGVIICQRKKTPYEGYWEFPGGKLEKGETKRQCLIRELREELNIVVSIDRFLLVTRYNYLNLNIYLYCYICSYLSGSVRLTEHRAYKILDYQQILRVKLLAGNMKILKKLNSMKLIY